MTLPTLGVEEEFQLLDAGRLALVSLAPELLAVAPPGLLMAELPRSQVEAVTPVCATLDDVEREVSLRRGAAIAAGRATSLRIASCGAAPLAEWRTQTVATESPYDEVAAFAGHLVAEQLIAGLHVHVGVEDPEAAVAVLDRSRDWLHVLLALSASSPFWSGRDTGFASFRAVHWRRWPASGPPPHTGTVAGYDEAVGQLLRSGVLLRESQVYWDARRSARFPTVEFRVCDAVQTVAETVALTGICRALAVTAQEHWRAGRPAPQTPEAILRLAGWQAARDGLTATLLLPGTWEPRPAADVVEALFTQLGDGLQPDRDRIVDTLRATVASGGGAGRQRAAALAGGPMAAARLVVEETARGVDVPLIPRVVRSGALDAAEARLAAERPPHHG